MRRLPAFLAGAVTALATVLAVSYGCDPSDGGRAVASAEEVYDPLAYSRSRRGVVENAEAGVPPMCYTKTAGVSNPCWTCHTVPPPPIGLTDVGLQEEYAFSDFGLMNRWSNLFVDRAAGIAGISDDEALAYVRRDNYRSLAPNLRRASNYPGWIPDLDLDRGLDSEGFAADGSSWRSLRYKPFPGTFWPTNGSTDAVFIRLPAKFYTDVNGAPSREIYKLNLAVLEASIAGDPAQADKDVTREVEPLDEARAGVDLDGDGKLGVATRLKGLPPAYFGKAADEVPVRRFYPKGTEFLHPVYYLDPDAPTGQARRMKELRYSVKREMPTLWALQRHYERELQKKEEGLLPGYGGDAEVGLVNGLWWQYQGFIEDAGGRLRLMSEEETRSCMGCHSSTGVTVDSSFALPRKAPGLAGWKRQDLRGMFDVPQRGHAQPEVLTYFKRVKGGDEFRGNDEILARFFSGGALNEAEVLRAAPGGDRDLAWLLAPSRERALALNKAYWLVVREQSFTKGKDAVQSPMTNVHRVIQGNGATENDKTNLLFQDGTLYLKWE